VNKKIMNENNVIAEIEMVAIDLITPNEYNPNSMDENQFASLVSDFQENGWVGQPVIINEQNEIIDGEHRWRCAKFLGYEKVPTVKFNPKDEDHQKMLTIGWNAKRGEMSPARLAGIIQELNQRLTLEEMSSKMGFSMDDIREKLASTTVTAEFIEELKKQAETHDATVPVLMNFAITKEQEIVIQEALEKADGKTKGEKLENICGFYLKQNNENVTE
jgi:ParB family chromosome partitioning protein